MELVAAVAAITEDDDAVAGAKPGLAAACSEVFNRDEAAGENAPVRLAVEIAGRIVVDLVGIAIPVAVGRVILVTINPAIPVAIGNAVRGGIGVGRIARRLCRVVRSDRNGNLAGGGEGGIEAGDRPGACIDGNGNGDERDVPRC